MMISKADDFEAVRAVFSILKRFEPRDQERIIRWAREKLGLASDGGTEVGSGAASNATLGVNGSATAAHTNGARRFDIKALSDLREARTDNLFAVAVAHYYRFDAVATDRKSAITADDLRDACRKAGRAPLRNPGQTLRNARFQGYMEKATERGAFSISDVGRTLVATGLSRANDHAPATTEQRIPTGRRRKPARRSGNGKAGRSGRSSAHA